MSGSRIMFAGTKSGTGKTTITCGILKCLRDMGLSVASFKCGPDYIDPMFHREVIGTDSYNLDSYMAGEDALREVFLAGSKEVDISVMEGVMGYYDGIGFTDKCSSYEVALLTQTPVILIVEAKGMGNSLGAVLQGFLSYKPCSRIAGVIFNRLAIPLYEAAKDKCRELGTACLGYVPELKNINIPSRHLGLLTAGEIEDIEHILSQLGRELVKTVDMEGIIKLAGGAGPIEQLHSTAGGTTENSWMTEESGQRAQGKEAENEDTHSREAGNEEANKKEAKGKGVNEKETKEKAANENEAKGKEVNEKETKEKAANENDANEKEVEEKNYGKKEIGNKDIGKKGMGKLISGNGRIRIAVAMDEAFSFYYRENLKFFEVLGGEIVPFSPIRDKNLPEDIKGLYLGGGYPELHGEALQGNISIREEIKAAVAKGMPTIAECGGFLYLQGSLQDKEGVSWDMVGAIPGEGFPTGKLRRFGYVEIQAGKDCLLADKGDILRAHEFHYWDSTANGEDFQVTKASNGQCWKEVIASDSLYAGFPHLYFPGNEKAARRFVSRCREYL